MIALRRDRLEFRFPDVHSAATGSVEFQRTLRLPDDNRSYALPPGLGRFPVRHVDDYAEKLPQPWLKRGGVLMPMYQSEAMWISFSGGYPMAIKVAAGKVCALTGESWSERFTAEPQNYLVTPDQPWLDGFNVGEGLVRQFVAMPLGAGFTAEEQVTGEAEHGGLQFMVCPMKADEYRKRFEQASDTSMLHAPMIDAAYAPPDMGLAPGGLMRQEIYEDEYGLDVWDFAAGSRCFVHILNSVKFLDVTGDLPPGKPTSARDYTRAGLPWFDYYASDLTALKGSAVLAGLDSVAARMIKEGQGPMQDNDPVTPEKVVKLKDDEIREGDF